MSLYTRNSLGSTQIGKRRQLEPGALPLDWFRWKAQPMSAFVVESSDSRIFKIVRTALD